MCLTKRGVNASISLVPQAFMSIWMALVSGGLLTGIISAQENERIPTAPVQSAPADNRTDEGSVVAADSPSPPDTAVLSAENTTKRKKLVVVLAAVAGIAIFGVGAITVTMVWARRLRRMARDPGPRQKTAGNDFWFLKPEKLKTTDSDVDDSHPPPFPPPTTESPK